MHVPARQAVMDIVNADEQAKAQATIKTILQALSGIRYGFI